VNLFGRKTGQLSIKDLEEAYLNHKNALLKFAYVLVGNIESAEDIVQDAFVGFAKAAGRKETFSNVKAYLMTAVLNKARNYYRDSKKDATQTLDYAYEIPSNNKSAEQWAILSEELELLSKAVGSLPPEQRETVLLYMQGDITFKQIAQIQEVPISTVQGRFRYGIERLQRLLGNEVKK
jgi:RNA polymerase sigma-70 factor (ECF subfamily)